jgi:fructose-specific phosphotransferase system IIA component
MSMLCKMISPDWILVDEDAVDKRDCIKKLIHALEASGDVQDPDQLYSDIMDREALCSTSVGSGCAIPHAHSAAISSTRVAAFRPKKAIDFQGQDEEEVKLIFLMAGPKKDTGIHLKVLSKIARLLHDPGYRSKFLDAPDAEAFYRVLCQMET